MASEDSYGLTKVDGSLDWSGGVNSILVSTVASERNPNGLKRNQLAWLDNATVRGGAITQRPGVLLNGTLPTVGTYQGTKIYVPTVGQPYCITVIDGNVWRYSPDDPANAVNLSAVFGKSLPITERVFFCQAEMFLVIQAGDGVTLPLFYDGATLWQSKGIVNPAATPATGPHINELPAATAMCYYMGRIWYAQNRLIAAGDIAKGASAYPFPGPPYYNGLDSVLCVQENPFIVGGDGFQLPSNTGNIRGIAYAANLNASMGQGNLYVGTSREIYQMTVPVTRGDWINATAQNQPLITTAVRGSGWVSDRSIVGVNSDLFFQTAEPAIRSLNVAVRYFGQWGNVPLSVSEQRLTQYNDRTMLKFGSGVQFDNRLLQTALPFSCPVGVAHRALIPLNFDVISNFGAEASPAWEGMWEGWDVLEVVEEEFGGLSRAFALVWSDITQSIQVWEFSKTSRWDKLENRVLWYMEFPAFVWESELTLKKLVSAELWYDILYGEVMFKLEWRPDGYVCWIPWHEWKVCTEGDDDTSVAYPSGSKRVSYRQMQTLPIPPLDCTSPMARPSNIGFQFQCRLTVKGYCRIRGFFLKGEHVERALYSNIACD